MRNIITAFCVGMSLAGSVLSGEEDLRTGGPWVLTLIVFPACALICLATLLRDHRKRFSAADRGSDSSASNSSASNSSVSGTSVSADQGRGSAVHLN
ncbi:hypothetical protein [Brevibacterium atlanticum]|uniref:hypothetical protein n=1 Tax=Brevibacterium atlanticum TaxID=2697563 RepID=UPI0014226AA8|nr:hypothetical protein [Brevibacterium atlanticum]